MPSVGVNTKEYINNPYGVSATFVSFVKYRNFDKYI